MSAENNKAEAASVALLESLMTGKGCIRAIAAVGGYVIVVCYMFLLWTVVCCWIPIWSETKNSRKECVFCSVY